MEHTKEELLIANAVFDASNKAETAKELLDDFIESYIGGTEEQETLKFELQHRPKRIEAKLFTLFSIMCDLSEELAKLAL